MKPIILNKAKENIAAEKFTFKIIIKKNTKKLINVKEGIKPMIAPNAKPNAISLGEMFEWRNCTTDFKIFVGSIAV